MYTFVVLNMSRYSRFKQQHMSQRLVPHLQPPSDPLANSDSDASGSNNSEYMYSDEGSSDEGSSDDMSVDDSRQQQQQHQTTTRHHVAPHAVTSQRLHTSGSSSHPHQQHHQQLPHHHHQHHHHQPQQHRHPSAPSHDTDEHWRQEDRAASRRKRRHGSLPSTSSSHSSSDSTAWRLPRWLWSVLALALLALLGGAVLVARRVATPVRAGGQTEEYYAALRRAVGGLQGRGAPPVMRLDMPYAWSK